MKFLVVLLFAAVSVQAANPDWWKTAVFYQIYPRSFKDSNNDGVGDLQGVIEKIDHLVDIGVTALWLSPIYKSPQKDHGYDISDFRDIDAIFGTMADFDELVQLAHSKGLKVIMDLVPNHSSDEHEWFKLSEAGVKPYDDYYIWLDGKNNKTSPPNNWVSYFHGSAWKWSDKREQYYLHQFHSGQPDLDFRNPVVVQEMKDIITFWLDKGVDGFRVDTIPSLVEVAGYPDEPLSGNDGCTPNDYCYLNHPYTNDQPETFDMVYQWRDLLNKYTEKHGGDTRVMMTEAYSGAENLFPFYGNATHDGAHFTFNFWLITNLNSGSGAKKFKETLDNWMSNMKDKYTANWVLGNHDQHRVASRYGSASADGLNMLASIMPGVAITYNGEEIGMEDGEVTWEQGEDPQACQGLEEDFDKSSRDFQRTPYQWDETVNAGFNEGHETWLPVSQKYHQTNLAAQKASKGVTHYSVYKDMLKLRQTDALKRGKYQVVAYTDDVLTVSRWSNNETYTLVFNMKDSSHTLDLTQHENVKGAQTVAIAGVNSSLKKGDALVATDVPIAAHEAVILRGKY